jgi:RNA polymerase sigma factor (sigma-70 family)
MTTKTKSKIVFRKRDLSLTDRQQHVLKLYARGKSYSEIAEELKISPTTVSGYLQDVRRNIRAKSRADVITEALKLGLMKDH